MKTFSELFSEAKGDSPADDLTPNKQDDAQGKGEKTSSKKEKELKDKHIVDTDDHPESEESQFKGGTKKDSSHDPKRKTPKGETAPKVSRFMKKLNIKQSKTNANANATKPQSVKEELITEETGVIESLKKIASSGKSGKIEFKNGGSFTVDKKSASVLVGVYEALKPANAKKFATNLMKGKSEFMKMLNFADSAS